MKLKKKDIMVDAESTAEFVPHLDGSLSSLLNRSGKAAGQGTWLNRV